jgi:hypothetical protein
MATSRECGLPGDENVVTAYVQRGSGSRHEVLRLVAPVKVRFDWVQPQQLNVVVVDIFADRPDSWPEIEKLIEHNREQTYEGVRIIVGSSRQLLARPTVRRQLPE